MNRHVLRSRFQSKTLSDSSDFGGWLVGDGSVRFLSRAPSKPGCPTQQGLSAVSCAVNRHVLSYGLSYGAGPGQPVGRSGWDTDPAHCFFVCPWRGAGGRADRECEILEDRRDHAVAHSAQAGCLPRRTARS